MRPLGKRASDLGRVGEDHGQPANPASQRVQHADRDGEHASPSDAPGRNNDADPKACERIGRRSSPHQGEGGERPEKVALCHIPPGNPDNARTLSVSEDALAAHLGHGDSPGGCS